MVRIGVIGAGYLGKLHIEKFLSIQDCELTAIADNSEEVRKELKKKYNIPVYADYRELIDKVDAVSVVVPTNFHYEVASFFIERGKHTFIEKPVTYTVEEGEKLLLKSKNDIKVQVGHIERFNPVYIHLLEQKDKPHAISIRRKAPFSPRGTEVDILFDLMIHDIDMVLSLFPNKNIKIQSIIKTKVVTDKNDYFKADFYIDDTLVSLEASRLSNKKERIVTAVYRNAVWEGDFITQEIFIKNKDGEKILSNGKKDILLEELKSFILAIKEGKPVRVTLKEGIAALTTAYDLLYWPGKTL